ncbi:HAD family phosphatase [Candidatus Hecatella orcuttiae]|jgi:phosphoserine phosphatase|uniref:HAD family hydrolase n=1 Tax=Candidatus Hecatella orcuttiae TaxID=1935119 RepID=UPI0028680748|nr:HAD family phosphatase [Candidatus Hecatella orcuttiae]
MSFKAYKAVVFDMDGTLIKEQCWEILHRHFHVDWEKTQKFIEEYAQGRLSFEELVKREIKLWEKDGKLPYIREIDETLKTYTLTKNAKKTTTQLRQAGLTLALVSYGLDILAYRVGRDLKIDRIYANTLEVDAEGRITGNQFNRVELGGKNKIVRELALELGMPLSKFVVVGDTKYDLSMFEGAGLKIAFNPKDRELGEAADVVIRSDDLERILDFIL